MFVIACKNWRRADERRWLSSVIFPDLTEQGRNTAGDGLVLAVDQDLSIAPLSGIDVPVAERLCHRPLVAGIVRTVSARARAHRPIFANRIASRRHRCDSGALCLYPDVRSSRYSGPVIMD